MAMSDAEKQAMKETMAERAKARKKMSPAQFEAEVVEKIEKMAPADKALAKKIHALVHALVKKVAPGLQAKTWYGMQAYCDDQGKTVVFFQDAGKFKARYSTLGFQDAANLDKDEMWATSFALIGWNADVEKKITALIKKAVS
jgi:uncharacterized protein YdhG (YjbR/CyaY superfamily)